jgi:hypothetical protein
MEKFVNVSVCMVCVCVWLTLVIVIVGGVCCGGREVGFFLWSSFLGLVGFFLWSSSFFLFSFFNQIPSSPESGRVLISFSCLLLLLSVLCVNRQFAFV